MCFFAGLQVSEWICLCFDSELFLVSIMVDRGLHSNPAVALAFWAWISSHFDAAYVGNTTKEVIYFDEFSVEISEPATTASTWGCRAWSSKFISCALPIDAALEIVWTNLERIWSWLFNAWWITYCALLLCFIDAGQMAFGCLTSFEATASRSLCAIKRFIGFCKLICGILLLRSKRLESWCVVSIIVLLVYSCTVLEFIILVWNLKHWFSLLLIEF